MVQETQETTFFSNGSILVTNARFVGSSGTFAMANISSVKSNSVTSSLALPIALILVGIFALFGGAVAAGLIFLAAGLVVAGIRKTKYKIMVNSNAGEVAALETTDSALAKQVLEALNNAIVHRG
jgi:hypothetical protein